MAYEGVQEVAKGEGLVIPFYRTSITVGREIHRSRILPVTS